MKKTVFVFNEPFRAHLTDIIQGNVIKPVSRHFTSMNHTADGAFKTILMQTTGNINIRLQTEESWIHKVKTRSPHGLNLIQTYACDTCYKDFTTRASLHPHNMSFHEKQQTKYQCWTCFKTYVRKESVIKHSKKVHDNSDNKFMIVTTTNTTYYLGIFKPDP